MANRVGRGKSQPRGEFGEKKVPGWGGFGGNGTQGSMHRPVPAVLAGPNVRRSETGGEFWGVPHKPIPLRLSLGDIPGVDARGAGAAGGVRNSG